MRKLPKLPPGAKILIEGPPGPKGDKGDPGRDGVSTRGPPGKDGKPGEIREVVRAVIPPELLDAAGDMVRIKNEIEALKKAIAKKTAPYPTGGGGSYIGGVGGAEVRYNTQTEEVRYWTASEFVRGFNIIGVRAVGPTTVYLPNNLEAEKIIRVKDEAGSGNVQIIGYNV